MLYVVCILRMSGGDCALMQIPQTVNPYPASHTKIVGISTMLRDHDFFQSLRSHDQKKYGAGFLRNAAFRTCIESWGSPVKVLAESNVEVGELKYFLLF